MKKFDLEDRTLSFSKSVLETIRKIPFSQINKRLKDQIVRSATSIGANYREANETDTKKDFRNRIRISKKEAKETIYWLDLLIDENSNFISDLTKLKNECREIMYILASIYIKISK